MGRKTNLLNDRRGFMVSTRIKKRWFRPDEVLIVVTDGLNDLHFTNTGTFTVETDKPLEEAILRAE